MSIDNLISSYLGSLSPIVVVIPKIDSFSNGVYWKIMALPMTHHISGEISV